MTLTTLGAVTLGTILEGIFYGVSTVLFILYLVLRHRNSRGFGGALTLAQTFLFSLCTLSLCLDISGSYFYVMQDFDAATKVELGWLVVFIMIDFTAQLMLIYRCWVIWDKRWVVVAVPGSFAFVTLGQGLAYIGLTGVILPNKGSGKAGHEIITMETIGTVAYAMSLSASALTTSLIVTKIFLTSREIHPAQGSSNLHRSLRIIAAMLIESGLLMFTFQLAFVVVFSLRPKIVDIIACPTGQIYGIAPTLLNIRVTMGTAYEKTTEKTASLRFAHSGGAATQVTGTSISAAGIQFRSVGTESDDASGDERVAGDTV